MKAIRIRMWSIYSLTRLPAVIGKPGVPDYLSTTGRRVNWDEVFDHCARWRVALEMNCAAFRRAFDLPLWISLERPSRRDAQFRSDLMPTLVPIFLTSALAKRRYTAWRHRAYSNRFSFGELKTLGRKEQRNAKAPHTKRARRSCRRTFHS